MGKNVLVIGANGMLGTAFREIVGDEYCYAVRKFNETHTLTDLVLGDISNFSFEQYRDVLSEFDVIINCAAITDVDGIETDVNIAKNAWDANVTGPKRLADICREIGATLIHFSSDYVFDGAIGREYYPCDYKNPVNLYGAQKKSAEKAIIESGCNYLIFRISWLFSEFTPNFVTNIVDKVRDGENFIMTNNIISSPTYARELVQAIKHIIDKNLENNVGIYHFTNEGCCTRYDMVEHICQRFKKGNYVHGVPDSYWGSSVKRPFCSVMSKQSFKTTFGYHMEHWQRALDKCIDRYLDIIINENSTEKPNTQLDFDTTNS